MDLLSDDSLNSMIRGEPVGDQWPYAGGSERDIAKHLKKVVSKLKRLPGVAVEAEFGNYGSGYASYIDAFCYPQDRLSRWKRWKRWKHEEVAHTDGISVYLSRVAPLAVLGGTEKTRFKSGSGFGFVFSDTVDSTPSGEWSEFVRRIRSTITGCGFTFMDRETAMQPLPFDAEIPTVLAEPPYTTFDAVFFWAD